MQHHRALRKVRRSGLDDVPDGGTGHHFSYGVRFRVTLGSTHPTAHIWVHRDKSILHANITCSKRRQLCPNRSEILSGGDTGWPGRKEIGRASCRERVESSVDTWSLKRRTYADKDET